jgi:hypothetical protein
LYLVLVTLICWHLPCQTLLRASRFNQIDADTIGYSLKVSLATKLLSSCLLCTAVTAMLLCTTGDGISTTTD